MATNAEMHLMYRVGNAPIEHFPFPHIYVRDVFPEDFYRRLRENLPPKEALSTLTALKRVTGDYPESRLVLPLEPDHVNRLAEPYRAFWYETAAWLVGGEFASLVLGKFKSYLDERFGNARQQEFMNEALLVQDYTTYRLTPHTDSPVKVASFLFYLPEDDRLSHLGTSIYLPRDRRLVSDGTAHHKPEFFDRLFTLPYRRNTLFAFLKTPNAFHGVEPIEEPGVRRDLLLYDIKIKGTARQVAAPAPAPAAPASNIRFTF